MYNKSTMKKTKIIATIGPTSENRDTLKKMIESGMNVARLNFSHGEHAWHERVINTVRELSREMNEPVGILADLQGPRIRTVVGVDTEIKKSESILVSDTGKFSNSQFLISNSPNKIPNSQKILLDVANIVDDIEVGNEILIEDGLMKIKVVEKQDTYLVCEVIDGGVVKNHKGVNIPDAKLHIPVVTEKDEKDLEFALKHEVDFVALSFVSTAADINDLRERMQKILKRDKGLPCIVAKIERKEAIRNLDEVVKAADAVMVARGDLAIEVDSSKVVVLQKEIIDKCLRNLTPVIVATQMLNSMTENPRPTRAEISDVSNAVIDHTDAVMLSAESASGKYPVESVAMMSQIIHSTEESPYDDVKEVLEVENVTDYVVIIRSAYVLARSFDTKAILISSISGFTARLMSHFRPVQRLLVATNNLKVYNQLSLAWGVEPYLFGEKDDVGEFIDKLAERATKEKKLRAGDQAITVMGRVPSGEKMRLIGVKEIK